MLSLFFAYPLVQQHRGSIGQPTLVHCSAKIKLYQLFVAADYLNLARPILAYRTFVQRRQGIASIHSENPRRPAFGGGLYLYPAGFNLADKAISKHVSYLHL